eukprot:CAMPEP_0171947196 /NCGR_PEP_ID=MMETSP0993-20121228/60327_1 /TAXON_ID=483369 /ORGANISM="non described non described, Strain CCMP2098" /LENGTH=37 /DNA_ID= /DNA_START= /DNA_END= /DNA_ORIENTATION=
MSKFTSFDLNLELGPSCIALLLGDGGFRGGGQTAGGK